MASRARSAASLPSAVALAVLLAGLATAPAHAAGTICGTVRDALTLQPVPRAGIFVRTTSGTYTGYYGATDNAGAFCIGGIPAGTYDLEVRVDEYLAAYVRNVDVTDDVTGVEIPAQLGLALGPLWPNPARELLNVRFRIPTDSPVSLEVIDLQGKRVHAWRSRNATAGERTVTWNLRDGSGRRIAPGRYFVRLTTASATRTRSFAAMP